MNRTFFATLAFVALPGVTLAEHPKHHHEHHHRHHHHKKDDSYTAEKMAKECEDRMTRIKDAGTSLPPALKTEFEYNLKIATVEGDTLKDPHLRDTKKHVVSCHNHLNVAEHIARRHEKQVADEALREERRARDAERRAKAKERRAKRSAKMAKVPDDKFDHGKLEGASKEAPGTEAAKPIAEEKK